MSQQITIHALTRGYPNISHVITSPISIQNTNTGIAQNTHGIWDTGATGSAITKSLAQKLGLIPIAKTKVKGVHGEKDGVNVYAVKIVLNNQNVTFTLPVTECEKLTDNDSCEFLIGMDVISKGDFAITNAGGKTVMSFRTPSIKTIDFVQETKIIQSNSDAQNRTAERDNFLRRGKGR